MTEGGETRTKTTITLSLATPAPSTPKATHWFPFSTQALEREGDTTTPIDLVNGLPPGPRVSVSWNGSQVAVYSTGSKNHTQDGKFHLFHTSKDNSALTLVDHPMQQKLQKALPHFRGYAKFVYTGPDDKHFNADDERLIVCDGQCVSVYTTNTTNMDTSQEAWKQLHLITLLVHPKLPSQQFLDDSAQMARFLVESAAGKYFLWQKGWNVFVWHLENGSNVSCISLGLGILAKKGLTQKDMKGGSPKKVQFLYSDDDTIALRVVVAGRHNLDMAILFSAKTGRELAPLSASLLASVDYGHDSLNLAGVLAQFDGSTDGSTLPMPVLRDSDIKNTLGVVTRCSGQTGYGIYQGSPDKPSFVVKRQDSKLEISRLQATSTENGPRPDICPANCGGINKPLSNESYNDTLRGQEGLSFDIRIWDEAPINDPRLRTRKLLDVYHLNNPEKLYLRLEMDGSESVKFFQEPWILTVQGPVSLSIWRLPPHVNGACQLMLHWASFPVGSFSNDELSVEMCDHSSGVRFEHKLYEKSPVLIPIEISRASNGENTDVFIAGVQDLAKRFTGATEPVTREAVFQYLRAHIHGTPETGADFQLMPSVLVSENYNNINDELKNVKDFDLVKDLVLCQFRGDGGWIPHETQDYDNQFAEKMIRWYSSKLKEGKRNYFYLLLEILPGVVEKSDNQLALESTLLEIIDWCFIQAKDKGRPEELRHLIISIPELLTMRPRLARKITRLFAFFLARDRQAIIDNLVISNPPVLQQVFETGPIRLEECSSSILRFRYDPNEPVKDREYFTESVFVAPFSLLWSVELPKSKLAGDSEDSTLKAISGTSKSKEKRPMNPDCDFMMVRTCKKTDFLTSLVYLIRFQFVPELHVYVRPRHYHLSLLDNPAIEALVEYKWNAFGYLLYYVRFFTQCGYYSLIVFAAFMQVYAENPTVLSSTFMAIIAMAAWFLWHEFWQFVSSVLELVEIRKSAMFRRSKWYKWQIVPRYLK
ncbi:hypothetical protein BGZ82_007321 [Podila clonocystis]|nr:hypothetical protein BGZ82_007321 [Podila clonocystis]